LFVRRLKRQEKKTSRPAKRLAGPGGVGGWITRGERDTYVWDGTHHLVARPHVPRCCCWCGRRDATATRACPARPHDRRRSLALSASFARRIDRAVTVTEATTTRRPWRKAECPRNPVAPHETWAAYVRERDRKQVTLVCCGACVSGGRRHMSWSARGRAVMIGIWEDASRKATAGWWPARPGLVVLLARLPLQLRRLKLSWMR